MSRHYSADDCERDAAKEHESRAQALFRYQQMFLNSWRLIHGEPTEEERHAMTMQLEFLMACIQADDPTPAGTPFHSELIQERADALGPHEDD